MEYLYRQAADIIQAANHITAFTGADLSTDSGIPSFRDEDGLWTHYDPICIDIDFFLDTPGQSWEMIRAMFYDAFDHASPNEAHYILAEMEMSGFLHTIITQNIDNLHQEAGNTCIYEFHGTSRYLVCMACGERYPIWETDLCRLPPTCTCCGGILKPDFVFFGESIPDITESDALIELEQSDLLLIIGTDGAIEPACFIPYAARENGARIIEINPQPSHYTRTVTDVFLHGKPAEVLETLLETLENPPVVSLQALGGFR